VTIRPAVRGENGVGGWDLITLGDDVPEAGVWEDRRPQPQGTVLRLSDLLLGGGPHDGMAVLGADSIAISPDRSYPADATLRLALQVVAKQDVDSATTAIEIQRVDGSTSRGVRLGFPVRLRRGDQVLQYAIDLRGMVPGNYRVTLSLARSGMHAAPVRSAHIRIVAPARP
jgi:hypothetical protein